MPKRTVKRLTPRLRSLAGAQRTPPRRLEETPRVDGRASLGAYPGEGRCPPRGCMHFVLQGSFSEDPLDGRPFKNTRGGPPSVLHQFVGTHC